jgi:hypothetical protein
VTRIAGSANAKTSGAVRLKSLRRSPSSHGPLLLLRVVRAVRRIMHEPKCCDVDTIADALNRLQEATANGRSPRLAFGVVAGASAGTIRTDCADSQEPVPARRLNRSNSTTTEALVVLRSADLVGVVEGLAEAGTVQSAQWRGVRRGCDAS